MKTPKSTMYSPDEATGEKIYGARYLWQAGTGFYTNMRAAMADGALPLLRMSTFHYPGDLACGINMQILGVDANKYHHVKFCFSYDGCATPSAVAGRYHCDRFDAPFTIAPRLRTDGLYEAEIDLGDVTGEKMTVNSDDIERIELFPFGSERPADVAFCVAFIAVSESGVFDESECGDYFMSYDDGVRADWRTLTDEVQRDYIARAEKRVREIRAVPDIDPATVKGQCYYISSLNGDDSADGRTPRTAWRTLAPVNAINEERTASAFLRPGDAVFLERGSTFYCRVPSRGAGYMGLLVFTGVTYAAYGEGEKPVISNAVDFEGAGRWIATEYQNVWQLDWDIPSPEGKDGDYNDVGNIRFTLPDGRNLWGIKVCAADMHDPYCPGKPTINAGLVTNGEEVFRSGGEEFTSLSCLHHNLEFFHDWPAEKVYVYYDRGNPGECFTDIRMAKRGYLIFSHPDFGAASDILLHNLAACHCASYGIDIGKRNIELCGCEMLWTGGTLHGPGCRYGQSFESYGSFDGLYIHDCYVYQAYDSGLTVQTCGDERRPKVLENMRFCNNVLDRCGSYIEIWVGIMQKWIDESGNSQNMLRNVTVSGNYLLYAGYGYGHQREGKRTGFIVGCNCEFENCTVEDNVMLFGQRNVWDIMPVYTNANPRGIRSKRNVYAFNPEWNNMYYCWENLGGRKLNFDKHRRIELPYDERIIRYAVKIGAETDSVFYHYEHPLFPEEAQGVYH